MVMGGLLLMLVVDSFWMVVDSFWMGTETGTEMGTETGTKTGTKTGTESSTETGLHLEAVLPGLPVLLLVDQPPDQLEICKMEEVSKIEQVTSQGSCTYNQTCCAAAYLRCSWRNRGGRCAGG